jgi:hypothetical protein
MRNADSKIHSPRFDCCAFLFYSFVAVTFATISANFGRMHCSKRLPSFDHLIGADQHVGGERQAEARCRFQIDQYFERRRLLDR